MSWEAGWHISQEAGGLGGWEARYEVMGGMSAGKLGSTSAGKHISWEAGRLGGWEDEETNLQPESWDHGVQKDATAGGI